MVDSNNIDMNELRDLIEWLNVSSDIKAFSLKYGDLEISLSRREHESAPDGGTPTSGSRPEPTPAVVPPPVTTLTDTAQAPDEQDPSPPQAGEGEVLIKAPMVGTFYSAPKPGATAFVKVGQTVKPDTVLCIIEVMKLMNSLEAKVEGVVKAIYVADNEPVEYGQPLMLIETR